ncbi:MAG: hypothetical protein ABIR30_06145 [Chitinophagaceae bacterium]
MKKKLTITLIAIYYAFVTINAQKVTRIDRLEELNTVTAALWNRAISQHDVIGSDFRGKQEIGNAAAERYNHSTDLWFPIEVYKRTIGGELIEFNILDYPLEIDTDHNLHIVPTEDYLADFKRSIDIAIRRMDGNDPLVDSDVDFGIDCSYDDFKNYKVKEMEFEIDLHKSTAKNYFAKDKPESPRVKSPGRKGDIVYAYGPWISDALHCFKPEIHPAEQIWWRNKINNQESFYHLILSCDQSDRFDDKDDFDETEIIGPNRYLKKIWAPRPLEGIFAILFVIDPAKEKAELTLAKIGVQAITSQFNDGKINYLVYKNDTVAVVKEPAGPDMLKVNFEKIHAGLDGKSLYGYITIQAQVGNGGTPEGGYLFLKATLKKIFLKKLAYPTTN